MLRRLNAVYYGKCMEYMKYLIEISSLPSPSQPLNTPAILTEDEEGGENFQSYSHQKSHFDSQNKVII